MKEKMRWVLVGGGALIFAALGAAYSKRQLDAAAYYNAHLKESHSLLAENQERGEKLGLPRASSFYDESWGKGEDMWPIVDKLREDLVAKGMWGEATNYPDSSFVYSIAAYQMPDLDERLTSLGDCGRCETLADLDKGPFAEVRAVTTLKGAARILVAKSDEQIERGEWADALRTIQLIDHIVATAATGPNRQGILVWTSTVLTLHRKMLNSMHKTALTPEQVGFYRNVLATQQKAPTLLTSINYEYFTRYWAARNLHTLSRNQIHDLVLLSPSEDVEPPNHHAAPEAMASVVLDAWSESVEGAKKHALNPLKAGAAADQPLMEALDAGASPSSYVLVTMNTPFEQTGMMMNRALETRQLALLVLETIAAERAGNPLPDIKAIKPPQNDFTGKQFVRTMTSDGWVIALEDTKKPASLPYGLTDQVTKNILGFRWKSKG